MNATTSPTCRKCGKSWEEVSWRICCGHPVPACTEAEHNWSDQDCHFCGCRPGFHVTQCKYSTCGWLIRELDAAAGRGDEPDEPFCSECCEPAPAGAMIHDTAHDSYAHRGCVDGGDA